MYQNIGFLGIMILCFLDDLLQLPTLIFSDQPFAFVYRRSSLDILLVLAVQVAAVGMIPKLTSGQSSK